MSAPHQPFDSPQALDEQIAATLASLTTGDVAQARVLARQMASSFPKYALAQLLSAELESAAAFQDVKAADTNPMSKRLIDLLSEAQTRSQLASTAEKSISGDTRASLLPDNVIQMGTGVSDLLLVDLENSFIKHLVGDDQSQILVRQHYIASGKGGYGKTTEGDNKTPLGVYTITGKRKDSTLPDLYGSGALTLDYPNALDRQLGRTGYGIWIHGVPHAQQSRAPRSSEGCVTMSNEHMTTLMAQITPSETLVVLAHGLSYAGNAKRSIEKNQYRRLFENFQKSLLKENQADLATLFEKNQLHHARAHIQSFAVEIAKIDSKDITIIMNPEMGANHPSGESRTVMMQGYFGNENERQITLYWREQADGNWRIVTETLISPKT